MKTVKLTALILILLVLTASQRQVKYFINEHDFLTGYNVPKSEVLKKEHIRAEYDDLDRLIIKAIVNKKGDATAQEQFSYIESKTIIRQRDMVDETGHVFYQTIFGREPQSLSYIEWVFGVDSVKKWNDRFTSSDMNEIDKPENYRFFDVDAFEYGGKELDYDSLGRTTRDEWFRRPDGKSMHKYLYKYYDETSITHLFEYDSNGVLIMDVKLSPDGTEAILSFLGPQDSSFVNNSTVKYNLDGDLKWGYIHWKVPAEMDSAKINLEEIIQGDYTIVFPSDSVLRDSATYNIHFDGEGVKGYMATKQNIFHVNYDISPPLMTLEMDKYLKDISLSFTTSEPIDSAYIVWAPDTNFSHISVDTIILTPNEIGFAGRFKPTNQTKLVDGVMYNPEIYAIDRAGNVADPPGIMENVIYDITPPVLAINDPPSDAWVNHQLINVSTNEPIQSWKVMAQWQGGVADANAPYTHEFADTVQVETGTDLSAHFQLNDGSVYSYLVVGVDLAGNVSDTVRIDSIHYDITPPILTMIYPFDGEAINNATVSYAASEQLLTGEFLWTETEGYSDSLSTHFVELVGEELSSAEKIHISLTNEPLLTDGSSYSILFTGRDLAGNDSDPISISNVLYDVTPPEFTNVSPESGVAINHQLISYNISEELHTGAVTWMQTGGVADLDAPHTVDLADAELAFGIHDSINLLNMPKLQDGGIYSLFFSGSDRAGNIADTVTITEVLYDYTAPEMVIEYPLPRSISNTTAMTYSLSEELFEGQFKWIWLGGVEDTLAPYTALLTEAEKTEGKHSQIELVNNPQVVENALYTMSFKGRDRAGNKTKRAFVPGLQYDFTPPELTWNSPKSGDAVNHKKIHYENSELLESGIITWTWISGVKDPDTTHAMTLGGDELNGDEFQLGEITKLPPLVDGGVYDISYFAFDPAGNESNHIMITDILYDITHPVITISYPLPRSISQTSSVTYTLSEELHEGKFKWIWLGGVKDTLAPYTAILTLEERTSGDHAEIELSNNPNVVENALYTMTISGTDRAGNKTKRAFVPGLQYDFTPPELTLISPMDGDAVNHKQVHFINSEKLVSAQMIWRWTGGIVDDTDSPHIIDLKNEELHGTEVGPMELNNSPNLVDGAEYSLLYVAFDPAGNQSDTARVNKILYDITPPTIVLTYPESNIFTTETKLNFDVSENIYEFSIDWTGVGTMGESSPVKYNRQELLTAGSYNSDDLIVPALKDGFSYTILLNGLDRAGNVATSAQLTNVKIDLTPPEFSAFTPESGAFINHSNIGWTLSENIASGEIFFQHSGSDLILESELVDTELQLGERSPSDLINKVTLRDGMNYSISINGKDFAGNISEELKVENITYDISPPEFVIAHPKTNSFVNYLDVIYAVNEPLVSGKMIWINDREEKTSYDLRPKDYGLGKHILVNYDIQPEENMPYTILIEGTDLAGNKAESKSIQNVMFDITPPTLSILNPQPNTPVNYTKLTISISEPIKSGSVRWDAIVGNDPKTSHSKHFLGDQLKGGDFLDFDFLSPPELVNGVTYKITIEGTDLAGNPSDLMVIDGVLYDISPPEFVDVAPSNGQHIREPDIAYTLTEDLVDGKIYFDHVGGTSDPKTTHMITLAGSKRQKGTRGGKLPSSFIRLVNGAVYNIRFEGRDAAGNLAPEVLVENIVFDNEAPIFLITSPAKNSYINSEGISYSISEDVAEGKLILTRTSGRPDPNSPHAVILDEISRKKGIFEEKVFSELGWTDGATYNLSIDGLDQAGNQSKKVLVKNITYDVIPPILRLIKIDNNSHINNNTLSYSLSELLINGTVTFTQTGGTTDPRSPQIVSLTGAELKMGDFIQKELANGPNLINGAIYDIVFTGSDPAGNEAIPIKISNVSFDNQPPEMSISRPIDSEQIKTTVISYISNEVLERATVNFEQTSGTIDVDSPHRVLLKGSELNDGLHSDYDLGITSQLADGGRYSVTIDAYDKAGNKANIAPISDVFFDILPPDLSLSEPKSGSHVNSASVTYSTTEEMGKGKIIFTRTGGMEDPENPHEIELTGDRLKQGSHYKEVFDSDINLNDGSIYTIEFSGEDMAGNVAVNVSLENITYDSSPPIVAVINPKSNGFYNQIALDYDLNETLLSGKIIFEHRGGIPDPMSPHEIELSENQLMPGQKIGININALTDLVSNATYNVSVTGIDLAGNEGNSEDNTGITFDNIPPEIAIISPTAESYIKSTVLGLKTNEVLSVANVVWTWVDGNLDAVGNHESKLVGNQLQDGVYPEVDFNPPPTLISGARYSVAFFGTDRAGNNSSFELGTLFFDNTPPVITGIFPTTNGFTNLNEVSYDLDEPLLMANLSWTPTNGSTPVSIDLTGDELNSGAFAQTALLHQTDLSDGIVYNLIVTAIDRSGNEAVITLAENVTYDKTKPKFTQVLPSTSSRVNSQLLKWNVNEDLVSGKYTWIHMGGKADPAAPHTFELTPELYSVGAHDNSTLPDLNLITDAMYRITLQGTDKAGNTGKKFIMSVVYDDIPPKLQIKYPEPNSFKNHLDVAYYISEGLSFGQFVYTQIGGKPDPNSPVTFDLAGIELETIFESPKLPKNPPLLNDGSIYNIVFKGKDLAMNESESIVIDSVKFDVTRPVITIHKPENKSNMMGAEITIEISEDLMDGKMVWTRTGGLKDRVTRHKIPLFDKYLTEGMHTNIKVPVDKSLSASVIYSLSIEAQDYAKNKAEQVSVEFIEYIRSMAGNWYYKGQIIEVIWVFEPDETGIKGNFMQGLSLGTKISDQEEGQFSFDFSKKPWVLTLEMNNPEKNRISLMEFLDNTHMRVVTGEKKPRSWQDGEVMEYEWRPK